MTGVEFTAALSLAEKDPVGGAIAGALEARSFAERFEQDGADLVALLPVARELSLEAGEQMGGQAGQANPGQDEIAGVIDDQRQVALAGGGIPADETVARGGFPGRGAAAEQGQQEAVGGVDEVAQLGAGQGLVAEVVVALDEFVPEAAAGIGGAQQGEAQGAGLGERAGQGRCAGTAPAVAVAARSATAAAGSAGRRAACAAGPRARSSP